MSKELETINILDDYILVDTTNRRVCEVSNPIYDRMFRGSKFSNEMATLLVEYRNQISNLQSQLEITEKALELACETIKQMCGKPLWIGGNIPSPEPKDSKYFKDIAKEMLENE